jgi:diaminopimelate epimerase
VTWVDDLGVAPVTTSGPLLERHPSFPTGTNVEFALTRGRSLIELRVWERGVGETLACGTGAAATAAVAADLGLVDLPVTIRLPGGDLTVDLRDDRAYITGPADTVFAGEWPG